MWLLSSSYCRHKPYFNHQFLRNLRKKNLRMFVKKMKWFFRNLSQNWLQLIAYSFRSHLESWLCQDILDVAAVGCDTWIYGGEKIMKPDKRTDGHMDRREGWNSDVDLVNRYTSQAYICGDIWFQKCFQDFFR